MSAIPPSYGNPTRIENEQLFSYTCKRHFGVDAYYWQATIGGFIMDRQRPPQRSCRVLCIQGTGKGKSILYQTLAAHFTGVTIYVSPLLTLGADQVNKLMERTRVIGYTIIPIHLDALKGASGPEFLFV